MTPNEAHDYAMGIVKELQAAGIATTVTKYGEGRSGPKWEEDYQRILDKYGREPDRASPDKWCRANFKPVTDEQRQLLGQKQKELGWLGICFDHGGGCGGRDWELDWSFRLREGVPDSDREQMVEGVNELIDGLEKGTLDEPPA